MTTLNEPNLSHLKQAQEKLTARLVKFRQHIRLRLVIEGLAILLAETAALAFLTLFFDWYLRLSTPARILMLLAAVAYLAYEAYRRVYLPCRVRLGLIALAGALAKTGHAPVKDLAARVASVLELPRLLESPFPPSPAM